MVQITIRNAVLDDATALAGLSHTLGYRASILEVRARLLPIKDSNDNCVLVACAADGTVVGLVHVFLALRIESDTFAEVGGLVVAEDQRGQGIASGLMSAAENWAMARGVNRMRVRSRTTRTAAHAFYQDLGYTMTKEQKVFEKTLKHGDVES
jgi:GNAT superfamily N-acetyltransferase